MIQTLDISKATASLWEEAYKDSSRKVPFYSYAWQELYVRTIGKQDSSLFLHLSNKNIIAPLSIHGDMIEFSGGVEISDYMDLVGPEENKAAAWEELIEFLKAQKRTSLFLQNILEGATLTYFKNRNASQPSVEIAQIDTTPTITLPDSFEAYKALLPHKEKHELERKLRKFEREHPGITITTGNSQEDLNTLVSLMRLDEQKQAFLTAENEAFFHAIPNAFPDQFHIQIACDGQNKVGAILSFLTDSSYLLYNSGFDMARYPGAGFYVKAKSIQWATEHRFKTYNFLQGSERYKYDLGGKDAPVYSVNMDLR